MSYYLIMTQSKPCFFSYLLPSSGIIILMLLFPALKPFIAESKLIAELSEKFVMINVEVRHSFVDYEHKFCWYVEFLLRTNEHRNLRKLKCLILSHSVHFPYNTTIFFFCTFCRTTKNPRMTSLMWMANTSLESFS